MSQKTILVWFRNDLRIHDNEILFEAIKKSSSIVPVYCFDPRYFSKSSLTGSLKTGAARARFLIESVADLKRSLARLGGDLLVVTGKPEEILPQIVKKYEVTEVYHHREVAVEETGISALVEASLWKQQINLRHFIGHTLYHKEELPFPIKDIPDVFTVFRKKIERDSKVRPVLDSPSAVPVPPGLEKSTVPCLRDLGFTAEIAESGFTGGETSGLSHLYEYLSGQQGKEKQRAARSSSGSAVSSRLSPWISVGCLSVRQIYWEIRKFERQRGNNEASGALMYELLWRDYYRFMFKKYGNRFFAEEGFNGSPPEKAADEAALFVKWMSGKTGDARIDGYMNDLNSSGYLGSRERKIVAAYLVNDMKVNWTWGAAYFEEKLIDYSPASNWGNWAREAGVGKG